MMATSHINHSILVPGTVEALFKDDKSHPSYSSPILQIIHLKKLSGPVPSGSNTGTIQDRYRVIFSDGIAYFQGMLAANLNLIVEDGRISLYSVVHLKKFTCSLVKDRKILIVLDIVSEKTLPCETKIGNPINIEEIMSGKTSQSIPTITTGSTSQPTSPNAGPQSSDIYQTCPNTKTIPSFPITSISQQPNIPGNTPNQQPSMFSNTNTYSYSKVPQVQPGPIINTSSTTLNIGQENSEYTPIASLSPYNNRWTIKARCISKQDIRVFTNARGQGKVFSVSLMDASGEIRATAFNDAVTQFFPLFEVGRVYSITRGQVKIAKRGFGGSAPLGSVISNPYDMALEKETIIKPLSGIEASSVPTITYSITPLIDLVEMPKDSIIDVLGVIVEVHPISTIVSKATGKQLTRRDLTIIDSTNCSIRVTLWGKQAEDAEGAAWNSEPVVALKGVKVSDWGGRTLNVIGSTQITLQPMDLDSALTLRGWYDSVGSSIARTPKIRNLSTGSGTGIGLSDDPQSLSLSSNFASITERKTFSQLVGEQHSEKPEYIDIVATITFIKFDGMVAYAACPGTSGDNGGGACQKKVIEVGPSLFRCEKCQRTYDTCNYRYVLSLHVADHTGQNWVNAFNDAGETLLGMPASELVSLRETDLAAFDRVFKKTNFSTWRFKLRAKQESYQGEMKMRLSVISMNSVPYAQESNLLLDYILA